MIGFGITLPVLPFYVERLALAGGASDKSAGLLTGVYALMQVTFAPVWGRWSDRIGRRPLIWRRGLCHRTSADSFLRCTTKEKTK